MNVAPHRTIILGLQILHRSLRSIGQKILYDAVSDDVESNLMAKSDGSKDALKLLYKIVHFDLYMRSFGRTTASKLGPQQAVRLFQLGLNSLGVKKLCI